MVYGVIGKLGEGDIEVAFVVKDLEREGVSFITVDLDLGTMSEMGGDVGGARCKIASDGAAKDDRDPWGVAGIRRNGGQQTKGNEISSKVETKEDKDEV